MVISNVSISAPSFAIGETGTITFTVKNTNAWTAKSIHAWLIRLPQHASDEIVTVLPLTSITLATNASRTYTRNFTVTSAMQGAFDYYGERAFVANLRIELTDGGGFYGQGDYDYVSTGAYLVDVRYVPSIPIFAVSRSPNADSTGAAVGLKCTLASGASPTYPGLSLTLKWKEDGAASFPAGNTLAVTVADALATNGTTVNPSYTFEVGKAYILRATFTDGIDSAFSEIKLSKAEKTLNVHPTSKNIGLGQFAVASKDADDVMRMDTVYRPYFHEGVAALANAHILAMLGIQTGDVGAPGTGGVPANSYYDFVVTFPTAYASVPLLFIGSHTGSTAVNMGSHLYVLLDNSLTVNGFTVRWYNNTSNARWPAIRWTAMGELDT